MSVFNNETYLSREDHTRLRVPRSCPLIMCAAQRRRRRTTQESMTAIDVEIIVGGDGGGRGRDMKCIKGRTKEKSQPTTRAAPDGWREARAARRGAAAAAGGSNKVGVPSHKCHRPREIRAGAARKFLPARARARLRGSGSKKRFCSPQSKHPNPFGALLRARRDCEDKC